MAYRQTDGLLIVGTHGNGIYSANITSSSQFVTNQNITAQKDLINIYPNPTKDIVYFQLPDNYQLKEILNLKGEKQVFKKLQKSVSLKKYSNGIYLFVFQNEKKQIVVKKIIKNY